MRSLLLVLLLVATASTAETPAPAAAAGPIVVLKLDDLAFHGKDPKLDVSPRWHAVTDWLEERGIHASYGIICESLAADRPAYIAWLKARLDKGVIELWNHGYVGAFQADEATGRKGQFVGTPLDEQLRYLQDGQRLAKEKLGVELKAFGPHVCAVDANTYAALERIPEIAMVFYYGPPAGVTTTKVVFERKLNLESPLFVPNPEDVQQRFEKYGRSLPYLCMQGHPNQWDEARFAAFTRTVEYLQAQGCRFLQPSEWLAQRGAPTKP